MEVTIKNTGVFMRVRFKESLLSAELFVGSQNIYYVSSIYLLLPYAAPGLHPPHLRHHDLPDLNAPCPKGPGAGKKVIFPHPFEDLVIPIRKFLPGFLKAVVPGK